VASLVSPRPLIIANPINGDGQLLSHSDAQTKLQWALGIYNLLGAENNLAISANAENSAILAAFLGK